MKKTTNKKRVQYVLFLLCILSMLLFAGESIAQTDTIKSSNTFGIKVRIGGRYDDVRMCVASAAGTKGGMAADISLFYEIMINNNVLHIDVPVFRPLLFAGAFKMLQFEPSISFKFRATNNKNIFNRWSCIRCFIALRA
ncbi:MAG: hypothetical protein GY756_19020 [bacterium]|nr:hypothetical protein [bacterium]